MPRCRNRMQCSAVSSPLASIWTQDTITKNPMAAARQQHARVSRNLSTAELARDESRCDATTRSSFVLDAGARHPIFLSEMQLPTMIRALALSCYSHLGYSHYLHRLGILRIYHQVDHEGCRSDQTAPRLPRRMIPMPCPAYQSPKRTEKASSNSRRHPNIAPVRASASHEACQPTWSPSCYSV